MAKIIGLTGGIGSGKTTVAKMFQDLGVPIYIADLKAKEVTNQPNALKLIEQQFGPDVVLNGKLDRTSLANLVFNNAAKLNQLNAIIHPLVAQDFSAWVAKHNKEKFVIKETAILFETGNHNKCDYVITVTAPIEFRIKRVLKRDQITEEEIIKRIANQWPEEKKVKLSDFVIENINLDETLQQVKNIYNKIVINL